MSLATRCTACGTVFRVVQDQLKVSEGWVRCGRCDQVFNAIEGLFDLERDAPPDWTPPPAPPAPPAAAITAAFQAPADPPEDDDDVFHLSDEDRIHSRFFQPEQEDVAQTPAQTVSQRDRVDFADARFNDALLADADAEAGVDMRGSPPPALPKKTRSKSSGPRKPPEFLKAAKRKALWHGTPMRVLLSVVSLLLLVGLALQAIYHFHDLMAARWPESQPVLQASCDLMKCRIGVPKHIDDIKVESSALSPANNGAAYRLSVVLRNRGTLPLALPSVDLTLTDSGGELVSRRALSPGDFRAPSFTLPAGEETTLQLLMSTDGRRVAGYTVEIFYP
ncbi:MAG: hypothetical protein RLZZ618_1301 [Pseudomonadota bacterium]